MPKIFYFGGGTHARGMLRAVVTLDQLESLVSPELAIHIGPDFPGASEATTIVEISENERTAAWATGFCRLKESPTDFDERLRFLPEPVSPNRQRH